VIHIELDGPVTRLLLYWTPPNGPVTRAVLGLDKAGDLVMYEWTAVTKVTVRRRGKGPPEGLSLSGQEFRRTD
jgi:hypothetical protein